MKQAFAMAETNNFHLTAGEDLVAQDAKPLVVERIPIAELIFTTQDRQPIFS
jgi:hypothetical protein